jgi:hypothetical protein
MPLDNYTKFLKDRFAGQRWDAQQRHIPFELTFEEWREIWEMSGKLSERGPRSHQYVMARFGDVGPYAVGNVKIITARENLIERHRREGHDGSSRIRKGRRTGPLSAEHKKKLSAALTGRKRAPFTAEHRENIRQAALARPQRSRSEMIAMVNKRWEKHRARIGVLGMIVSNNGAPPP